MTYNMTWHYISCHDTIYHGMAWHDMMWHDVTWLDVTRCDVTRRDMKCYEVLWYELIWLVNMIWYYIIVYYMIYYATLCCDTTRHDMIRYGMRWHDVTWYAMTRHVMIRHDVSWYGNSISYRYMVTHTHAMYLYIQRHTNGVVSTKQTCNIFGFGGVKRPFWYDPVWYDPVCVPPIHTCAYKYNKHIWLFDCLYKGAYTYNRQYTYSTVCSRRHAWHMAAILYAQCAHFRV